MRVLTPNIDELAVNDIVDNSMKGIANILCAAGYGEADAQFQDLEAKYGSQLKHIAERASKVALMIREGTMSTDYQVMFVDSSRTFNATWMENLYEGFGASQGLVLCTTEIGLQSVTSRKREGRNIDENAIEKRVVLKPKVVLESVVQILDR